MLSRPSGASFGPRNNNSATPFATSRRPFESVDENALRSSQKTLQASGNAPTKTPSHTATKRRAFGDISNRKQSLPQAPRTVGGGGKSVSFAPKTPSGGGGLTKKSSLTTVATKQSLASHKKSASKATAPRSSTKVQFAVPQLTSRLSLADAAAAAPVVKSVEVDDIELPAGRLWKDQQQLLDDQEDDDAISVEDWLVSAEERDQRNYARRLQQYELDQDRAEAALERKLQVFLKDEEEDPLETGLDELLETLDLVDPSWSARVSDDDISL